MGPHYWESTIGDDASEIYGRIRLFSSDDGTLRAVRMSWPVSPVHATSLYVAIARHAAEQLGGNRYDSESLHPSSTEFQELAFHHEHGIVVLDTDHKRWTPETGRIGVEASSDIGAFVDALCLLTSNKYNPMVAKVFSQYAAQARPYAPIPSPERSLSAMGMQI
jgi:hypothetical protein